MAAQTLMANPIYTCIWHVKDRSGRYMCGVAVQPGLIVAVLIDINVSGKLLSLRQSTSTHTIVAMLTAETRPHTGSYPGLYIL